MDPQRRRDARTWQASLEKAESGLTRCLVNGQHLYSSHLSSCPWCERKKLLNGRDPFPSIEDVRMGRHTAPFPRKPPTLPVAQINRQLNPTFRINPPFPPVSAIRSTPPNRSAQNPLSRAAGCLVWFLVIGAISSAQKNCSQRGVSANIAPSTYHIERPGTTSQQDSASLNGSPGKIESPGNRTQLPNPAVTSGEDRPVFAYWGARKRNVENNASAQTDWAPRAQLLSPEQSPFSLTPTAGAIPFATRTPVVNPAATAITLNFPNLQTSPDVLYSIPDLRGWLANH
jgi:hypothetical protein